MIVIIIIIILEWSEWLLFDEAFVFIFCLATKKKIKKKKKP